MPWRRTRSDDTYVSWHDDDMREVRRPRLARKAVRWLAAALTVTGFVVLMMEIQRDPNRCHQNCFDGSDNTFEGGHVWTAYTSSWQWDAQLALAWLALLVPLWALWAAGRRSRWETIASLGLSVALIAVWIVWVTVQPPPARFA
jgi:hypothetical protein